MIEEDVEASTSFSSTFGGSHEGGGGFAPLLLRPRREPFEHGLLPIPKLIFADGTLTLGPIQQRLLQLPTDRVDAAALADALQIPIDHALLALDTLAAVLPLDANSAGADVHDLILFLYMQSYKKLVPRAHKDSAAVADVWPSTSAFDGYLSALSPLQLVRSNTRRSMPSQADEEAHQLSYLQKHMANLIALLAESAEGHDDESLVYEIVGANGGKVVGGYGGIRVRVYESVGGLEWGKDGRLGLDGNEKFRWGRRGDCGKRPAGLGGGWDEADRIGGGWRWRLGKYGETKTKKIVLTMERFEHLGFLIQFEKGCDVVPLRQAAPFFSNSDSEMPAAPVSAAQVHDWISQIITTSLEHNAEKIMAKENGPSNASDVDVTMVDATPCHSRNQTSISKNGSSMQGSPGNSRTQTFVEGISKASLVKQPCDIKGHSVKILNCHDSVIYLLAPVKYAIVNGCSDATIVLGAIGKDVRVEHCERVQLIAAAKRICIANCRECIFYLGVNQRPLFLGDNHKLQVAPFNTYYPQLEEHLAYAGVDATINKWDEPVVLGLVDPHDSLSHPAGVSDVQAESAAYLDPEQFSNFWASLKNSIMLLKKEKEKKKTDIPNWFGDSSSHLTRYNPFPLPEIYVASQRNKLLLLAEIQKAIRDLQIDDDRRRELACVLHVHFKDWLYGKVFLCSTFRQYTPTLLLTGRLKLMKCFQDDPMLFLVRAVYPFISVICNT
ncbi:hypothetical protein IEQ34_021569 [Dendrobium chrysotoxum]|uniref:TBCC domain-containing protein 1 n=1 Tax=Dendrobium chrysotoxum TaxID=161865 RepID=A0AAV7G549_DENCH|nr:hypothetical protein IEQ34_021569 [Dendrobium chrysotoxum]